MGKKKTLPEPDEDDAFDDEEAPGDEDLDDDVFEEGEEKEDMEEERDEEEAVYDEDEEIEESSAPDDGAFVWVREPDHSREGRRGPKRGGEKRHTHHPSRGHPSNR